MTTKYILKILGIAFCFSLISTAQAGLLDWLFGKSDTYGRPVPSPTTSANGEVKFSTPALQGMEKNHVTQPEVEKVVTDGLKAKSNSKGSTQYYCENGICVFYTKLATNFPRVEVSSVWKES